jgi:hypothetical protein
LKKDARVEFIGDPTTILTWEKPVAIFCDHNILGGAVEKIDRKTMGGARRLTEGWSVSLGFWGHNL